MATAITKRNERQRAERLGKTAKSTAPLVAEKIQENRKERFKLQSVAAKLLSANAEEKVRKNPHKKVGDIHRTCDCTWTAISSHVVVKKSPEFKTAHYKNLATCGSVWACPVCTAKIQERRRGEIAVAMDKHYDEAKGQVMMVTLTAPHYSHQSLKELRDMQRDALSKFRNGSGAFKRMLDKQGYIGLIRSLEVTVSERNGWHLHTHELWFVDKKADLKKIRKRTLERWESACLKAGLLNAFDKKQMKAFREHSVDIKGSVSCSEYLAKMDDSKHWGADREVAKSSTKSGKKKGLHPFGLLAEVADDTEKSDWCAAKFIEYCNVMKGSRQLFWSRGLKDHFGINDKSDEELAREETNELIHVVDINIPTWKNIRKTGGRSTVLELAELNDKRALDLFLKNHHKTESLKPPSG